MEFTASDNQGSIRLRLKGQLYKIAWIRHRRGDNRSRYCVANVVDGCLPKELRFRVVASIIVRSYGVAIVI